VSGQNIRGIWRIIIVRDFALYSPANWAETRGAVHSIPFSMVPVHSEFERLRDCFKIPQKIFLIFCDREPFNDHFLPQSFSCVSPLFSYLSNKKKQIDIENKICFYVL
jgi:hypothetical protein